MDDATGIGDHAEIEARDRVIAFSVLKAIGVIVEIVAIIRGLSGSW